MRYAAMLILALSGCTNETLAGSRCDAPEDCFEGFESEELGGDPMCLTDVPGGYCTQSCTDDASCCAGGQCEPDFAYFCEVLESNEVQTCFVSCEEADGGDAVCGELGGGWMCRNTGGGDGRKFCSP